MIPILTIIRFDFKLFNFYRMLTDYIVSGMNGTNRLLGNKF